MLCWGWSMKSRLLPLLRLPLECWPPTVVPAITQSLLLQHRWMTSQHRRVVRCSLKKTKLPLDPKFDLIQTSFLWDSMGSCIQQCLPLTHHPTVHSVTTNSHTVLIQQRDRRVSRCTITVLAYLDASLAMWIYAGVAIWNGIGMTMTGWQEWWWLRRRGIGGGDHMICVRKI